MAATIDLVVERGVAGATIEAVAARSGVAKTTIYRQWPHQAALVLDAFRSVAPDPDPVDTGGVRTDLLVLLRGLAGALTSGPVGALLPALIEAAGRNEDLATLHANEARRRHRLVVVVLERAVGRAEIPEGTDLDALVDLLAGPLFHRRFVSGLPLDEAFLEHVVDSAVPPSHAGPDTHHHELAGFSQCPEGP